MNITNLDAGFCVKCNKIIPGNNLVTAEHGHIFHQQCFRTLFEQNVNGSISCPRCLTRVYEYEELTQNTLLTQESFGLITKTFQRALNLNDPTPYQFYNSEVARTLFGEEIDLQKIYAIIDAFTADRANIANTLIEQDPHLLSRIRNRNPGLVEGFLNSLSEATKTFLINQLGD